MLDRAGIVYDAATTEHSVLIESYEGPKNLGYPGFVAQFAFTADGALDHVSVHE